MPEPTATAEALSWCVRCHPAGGTAEEHSPYDWCCSAVRAADAVVLHGMSRAPTPAQLRVLCRLGRSMGFKRLRFYRAGGAKPGWHEIDLTRGGN